MQIKVEDRGGKIWSGRNVEKFGGGRTETDGSSLLLVGDSLPFANGREWGECNGRSERLTKKSREYHGNRKQI